MKKIYLLAILSFSLVFAYGQEPLYTDSFTTGAAGWQRDEDNVFDLWVVNNSYGCSVATPNQGGGNYLHISDDLNGDDCAYANYGLGGGGATIYATMTSGISTVGQSSVSIKFDWLCVGQTNNILPLSYGSVDYSVDGGSVWTNITQPRSKYSGQATWTTTTITSAQVAALANKSDLRLRFGFVNNGLGTNPAFAVDNLVISGDVPTSAFSSSSGGRFDVRFFPNPAKDELNIQGNLLQEKSIVTIFNMLGENMLSTPLCFDRNKDRVAVRVKNLPAGVYIVKVESEKGRRIERFVKE